MEDQELQTKQGSCWNNTDKKELVKVLSIILRGQKTYSQQSLKDIESYYRFKLEGRYTVNQIIHAIDIFTDQNNEVPVPADLIKILSPEPKKITQAEYIQACDYQKRNNFPQYSYEAVLINDYRKQQEEDRDEDRLKLEMHPDLKLRLAIAMKEET